MSVKIDCRERSLIAHCEGLLSTVDNLKCVTLTTENLHIGDILVEGKDKSHSVIIERKSVADLAASIKDGRYKEQSFRLSASTYHNHNIIYLIEGGWNSGGFRGQPSLDIQTLYGSVVSVGMLKGFSVFRTENMQDTAMFICNLARKLCKTKLPLYYQNTSLTDAVCAPVDDKSIKDVEPITCSSTGYASVVKIQKKHNLTPTNIGHVMISQIPGISGVTADAIMAKYGTIGALIKALDAGSVDELREIKYTTKSGLQRRINSGACDNIVSFLSSGGVATGDK